MKRVPFFVLLGSVLVAGVWVGGIQHRQVQEARAAARSDASRFAPLKSETNMPARRVASPRMAPSLELLRLRGEVTQLRSELDLDPVRARAEAMGATEWAQVFDGTRPSRMPDFQAFTNLAPRGAADPMAAFATFQYHMRNQQNEPMTPTRMKEIWAVPDDFDDPQVRYSIHLGRGLGREIGYRVVEQQVIEPGEVRLVIDLEDSDGGSHRMEQVLSEDGGRWRVKPESVTRLPDPVAE